MVKLMSHMVSTPIIVVIYMIVVTRMLISDIVRVEARRMLSAFIARRKGISKRIVINGKDNRKRNLLKHRTRIAPIHPRAM